jgi:hypothetical protein
MPMDDLTLIPSDETIDLPSPVDNIDADDIAIINAQAVIEKNTVTWQEALVKLHNFEVNAYFDKQNDDSLALQSQKEYFAETMLMSEDDGGVAILGKDRLFTRIKGADLSALAEVYTLPISEIANEGLRFKPQLHLYFVEINYLADSGRNIADGRIRGIRLMDFNPTTAKQSDVVALAERVRDVVGDGFEWKKGKSMLSYSDPSKGYNLQILCQTKDDGKEVLAKVLSIQNHEIVNKFVNFKENDEPEEAYPENRTDITILEKTVKTETQRPICTVKFRVAFLHINELVKPKVLFDVSGRYQNTVI